MYAELKCRSNFSFLMGASHPEELIRRAAELGLHALALSDRDGVYGIPKAYHAKKEFPQMKLITGAELTIEGITAGRTSPAPGAGSSNGTSVSGPSLQRLTLLARDRAGYGLLCRLLTASHADRPKGEAALPYSAFLELINRPEREGLIALPDDSFGTDDSPDVEKKGWDTLQELFRERLFIPLSRFHDGHDRARTERALERHRRYGARIVATNDVHYHVQGRKALHDVLTATRVGRPLDQAGFELQSNAERYLKSPAQMKSLFRDLPEAVSNTLLVAEQCRFCPSELRYRYPSEWIPQGHTAQSYLEELTWKGAESRYGDRYGSVIPPDTRKQLEHELGLIAQLGFADYFLTIYEVVEFARSRKILCQGRGSAANSAVCYCLGITAVDPVRMNLLFERFLSVERGEPPDIDVDFEHERREEVIQHIYEKYGRHRAAMVSAVITYQERSRLRDISKALGEAARPELIEKLSEELENFPRHLSIHSGGFTLSADPVIEIVPVEPARMEGRTIIQWDKYDLDYLGLLKVDILSIGMLSAIRKTLDEVGLQIHQIPSEDPDTYAMIQKADTIGVFQIESRAQMSMLGRLLPKTFYDLVVEVAIVRPGPIVGKMVHPYLRRRRGQEPVDFPDPRLKDILGRTLGVPLFQEQVMKLAVSLAGFTPGEADQLRRAFGAWKLSKTFGKMSEKLMEGLRRSGLPEAFVQKTFEQIQGFSMYGFPESHAASYALLAYVSSYLKCHYPAEFACSLINSQPLGFYANHTIVDDVKRHGVEVRPIDPNLSEWDCRLEPARAPHLADQIAKKAAGQAADRVAGNAADRVAGQAAGCGRKAIRMGWRVVHGMSRKDASALIEARKDRRFTSLADFVARTQLPGDVLQQLAMGNAFACFGRDPRHSLWEILENRILTRQGYQLSLFSHTQDSGDAPRKQEPLQDPSVFQPLNLLQSVNEDYDTFGLSTRMHPMKALRELGESLPKITSTGAKKVSHGRNISVAGMIIVRQRPPTAKGVTFATLEDEDGLLDLILHPDVFEKYRPVFHRNSFLIVSGRMQKDTHTTSMLVSGIKPLSGSFLSSQSSD